MDYATAAIFCFFGILIFMLMGMPIAYAIGFTSVVAGLFAFGAVTLEKAGWITFHLLYNVSWTPLPLFILMGCIISETTIGKDSYYAASKWLSQVRGGLVVATIMGEALMASILGTSTACIVTVGKVAVPEFKRHSYDKAFSLGASVCGGVLGPLIPPSVPFIIYGTLAQVSIGHLFIAGVIPGILLAIILSVTTVLLCVRNPALARSVGAVTWRDRFSSTKRIWPVVLVMIFIIFSIYFGIATPTEVGGVACVAVIIIAVTSFGLRLNGIFRAMKEAVSINAMIMLILVGSSILSYVLVSSGLAGTLFTFATSQIPSPLLVVISIMFLLIILGCFLEPITIQMLTLPLIIPVIIELGFSPVWFGVLFLVNMEIGMITPPMGLNIFIAVKTFDITTTELYKGILPFIIVLFIFLLIILFFPELSLWLPGMMT